MEPRRIAYKYRLLPDEKQKEFFSRCFGCTRLVYNRYIQFSLEDAARVKTEGGTYRDLPQVSSFKQECDFLKEVDSLALANAKRNFETARKGWWDSLKKKRKGKGVKAPTFKKKGKCRDSYTTNNQNGTVSVSGDMIKLPKVGEVRFVCHRPIPETARVKSATVSRDRDGRYYVSVLCEVEFTPPSKRIYSKDIKDARVVGLDMSLSEFYVSSDGGHDVTITKYVRQYRKDEKKIARADREHSRKELIPTDRTVFSKRWNREVVVKEPSKNREKARLRLARLHRKVANRRRDFTMQEAARLAKEYDVIVIEDLDMRAMAQSLHLGKSVNDLGWGMFKTALAWQCEKRGCELVVADRWFPSSKTCNHCGEVNPDLRLSDREWACPKCGCIVDRDYNAACNLRDWYYSHLEEIYSTDGTAGIHACGDGTSTPGETLGQAPSLKQESSVGDPEAPTYSK